MKSNYIKHNIANLINVTKIVTIHYYEFDKNYCYDGESYDFREMVYIDAGNVRIKAYNNEFFLKQGEVIFHKPNEFHTLKTDNETAANVFVISFVCSSEAMSFFKRKTMTVPSKLKKNISTIIQEYSLTFNPMATKDIKLELKENPPIGGQQMIKTYLSKIFKTATGYTILEYILKNKIREAKKLIREERYNFTQISDLLNFDNPHYFSTVFKKISNMTPSNYKNSVKKP